MLKKILAFALALLIAASMAACNDDQPEENPDDQHGQQTDNTDPENPGTTDPITDPEPEPQPEPEPEPQPVDPEAEMEEVSEQVYATVTVDLRSAPAIEDNVVAVLRYGQRATRIKKGTTWSKISYQGADYYVASNCLALYDDSVVLPGDKDDEPGSTVAPDTSDFVKLDAPETVYVVVDTALNLRAEPHINGEVKMRVGFATKMQRVALNNSWSEVVYNGQTYYAYSDFLTNEQITDEGYTPLAAPQTMYVTVQSMWVRYYPSMLEAAKVPYTVMDGLHYGDAVQVIAISPDNAWAKVIIMGDEYYVGYQFLSTAAPAGSGEIVEPEIPGGK
ncbi:MAG: hypothetical protein IJY66_04635 [Clostridia bacterium]|nr:hypothetical protein [Clostridia bacterium]